MMNDQTPKAPVAQRTEHEASTLGVAGSNPAGRAIPEKLCVFCEHLRWHYTEGDSCPTCGYDSSAEVDCSKKRWPKNKWGDSDIRAIQGRFLVDFRERILCAA